MSPNPISWAILYIARNVDIVNFDPVSPFLRRKQRKLLGSAKPFLAINLYLKAEVRISQKRLV